MKKICILLLLLFFTFTPLVLAHSDLESSVPQGGEVVTENISTLSLTFNTSIEDTSKFKITKENGQEVALAESIVKEKDMIGTLSSLLEDGTYKVSWKIIGDDGHPIENSYSFSVVTSTDTIQELSEPTVVTDKNNSTSSPEQDIIYESQTSNLYTIMVISIVLLMVIASGTTFWLLKRGKN